MATATLTKFDYQVRDRRGKLVTGQLEADNQAAVATRLKSMGYAPIKIDAVKESGLSMEIKIPGLSDRVKLKELAIFSRQFATMINSGLSLIRALSILREQTDNKKLAETIGQIQTEVESGQSLSQALIVDRQVDTSQAEHTDGRRLRRWDTRGGVELPDAGPQGRPDLP
jgi:type IV pilus assembly protein PilC